MTDDRSSDQDLRRELRAAGRRFRTLIEHNADGVVVVDREGIVRYANPAAETLFGRSADALRGAPFGLPLVVGETTEVDLVHRGSPGRIAEMRVVETEWEGEPVHLASLRDVSDRRRLEEQRSLALREQLARREAEAAARRHELLARAWEELASSLERSELARRFADLVCERFALRCQVILEGNDEKPADVHCERPGSVRGEDTPDLGVLELPMEVGDHSLGKVRFERAPEEDGPAFDETDRDTAAELVQALALGLETSRLYAKATEENRLRERFLATVSHELRTPLQSTLNWLEVIRARLAAGKPAEEGLDVIERNARAQARLVNDILDASRAISGKLSIFKEPLDLAAETDSVVFGQRPEAEELGVELVWQRPTEPLPVMADPDRLHQVVANLLSNALNHTPGGGRVEVAARRTDGHAELAICDSGSGVDEELLPHLFQPFRQGKASSERNDGLGLGLAVVKRLVDLHEGSVHGENRDEGGARFVVRLPLRED